MVSGPMKKRNTCGEGDAASGLPALLGRMGQLLGEELVTHGQRCSRTTSLVPGGLGRAGSLPNVWVGKLVGCGVRLLSVGIWAQAELVKGFLWAWREGRSGVSQGCVLDLGLCSPSRTPPGHHRGLVLQHSVHAPLLWVSPRLCTRAGAGLLKTPLRRRKSLSTATQEEREGSRMILTGQRTGDSMRAQS